MRYKQTIWLAVLTAAALSFPNSAKADALCSVTFTPSPTCFFKSDVVYLYYGTLTVLAPDGSVASTSNIVTAETGLSLFDTTPPGVPPSFIDLYPGLVGQLESDPQSGYADLPSYLYTGLTGLEDANGFGFVQDPSAVVFSPQDPAA